MPQEGTKIYQLIVSDSLPPPIAESGSTDHTHHIYRNPQNTTIAAEAIPRNPCVCESLTPFKSAAYAAVPAIKSMAHNLKETLVNTHMFRSLSWSVDRKECHTLKLFRARGRLNRTLMAEVGQLTSSVSGPE